MPWIRAVAIGLLIGVLMSGWFSRTMPSEAEWNREMESIPRPYAGMPPNTDDNDQ